MITEYTWRRLREGEKVWVYSSWMKFPMPGVIKHEKTRLGRPKRKCVFINFFSDCQTYWRPRDVKRLLRDIFLSKPPVKGDGNPDDGLHG